MLIASMGEMGLSHDNILEGDECLRQYWFEVEFLDFVSHLLYLLYEIWELNIAANLENVRFI